MVARSAATYTRTIFTFLGLFFKPVDDAIFNKKKSLYSPEGQLAGLQRLFLSKGNLMFSFTVPDSFLFVEFYRAR